jgi:predicted transposase/invertase (TIGR01784 family)
MFQAQPSTEHKEVLIYVLVEHQSTMDPLIALRMWRYIHGAWYGYLKDNPKAKKVPLIVPLLIYQDKREHASMDIRDLIDAPRAFVNKVWTEPIDIIDLHRISDEELRRQTEISAILLAMKHIRDEVFPLDLLLEALLRVEDPVVHLMFLKMVVNYIFKTRRDVPAEQVRVQVGRRLGPTAEEAVMTVAEQLRQEGKREGREEGFEEGREEGFEEGREEGREEGIVEGLLKAGMDDEFILKHTQFSLQQLHDFKKSLA